MDCIDACTSCASRFFCCGIRQRMLHLLLVLSILLNSYVTDSVQPPDDTPEVTITHSVDNKNHVLTCTVPDLGSRRIIWSKMSDSLPISVGTTRFLPSNKYRLSQVGEDQMQLTIRDVTFQDAGEYQCRASGLEYLAARFSINIPAASDSTNLVVTPTEIEALVGGEVLMPCHVTNLKDRVVMWQNSRHDVISLRRKVFNGDRRFSIVHDTADQWSLRLTSIKPSDFGSYTCVVNSRPVLTRTVTIKNSVMADMAPILKRDTNYRLRVEVDEGETVTLTCNFRSNPPAQVTWFTRKKIDGKSHYTELGKGNELTLRSVTPEQSERYVCIADNGLKPKGRGRTRLIVKGLPEASKVRPTTMAAPTTYIPIQPSGPRMYHFDEVVEARRGRHVQLRCKSIGWPRAQMWWSHNGHRLPKPDTAYKHSVSEDNQGRYTKISTLTIKYLVGRDYGKYVCIGQNEFGLVELPVQLNETRRSRR